MAAPQFLIGRHRAEWQVFRVNRRRTCIELLTFQLMELGSPLDRGQSCGVRGIAMQDARCRRAWGQSRPQKGEPGLDRQRHHHGAAPAAQGRRTMLRRGSSRPASRRRASVCAPRPSCCRWTCRSRKPGAPTSRCAKACRIPRFEGGLGAEADLLRLRFRPGGIVPFNAIPTSVSGLGENLYAHPRAFPSLGPNATSVRARETAYSERPVIVICGRLHYDGHYPASVKFRHWGSTFTARTRRRGY